MSGLARAAALLAALALLGCEPRGFLPGTRLAGTPAAAQDFAFAEAAYGVGLEVRAGGLLDAAWLRCVMHEGVLYGFTETIVEMPWMHALERDPAATLRVADRLYPARAVPLHEAAAIEPLLPALLRKYFAVEVEGARLVGASERFPGTQVGLRFWRIEPEPAGR